VSVSVSVSVKNGISGGFQPVSGRASRHPRKCSATGPGPFCQASAHVDKKTGWKPILHCAAGVVTVGSWRRCQGHFET
jgi:hypothetical protein